MSSKPFLKWAGSKYRLIPHLQNLLPKGNRLIEPFVGSGAVFLNLSYPSYLLNDSNADLIALYNALKQFGTTFITDAKKYFSPKNNSPIVYNQLRNQFNTSDDPYLRSLLFIYLNRHSYNGLCRYNRSGIFNVPFGQYKKPLFPEEQLIHFCEHTRDVDFHCHDFKTILQQAKTGDVIYCDPPYVKHSEFAQLIRYEANGFNEQDQIDLATLAEKNVERGITTLISNHDTAFTRQLYHKAKLSYLDVQRYISCKTNLRVPAKELLALFEGVY